MTIYSKGIFQQRLACIASFALIDLHQLGGGCAPSGDRGQGGGCALSGDRGQRGGPRTQRGTAGSVGVRVGLLSG